MANSYRMTDSDFRLMIQLRAANDAIFTGKKNSARTGWRAISKEMGLLGQVSPRQLKKKWDYLKEKYMVLKFPPVGMEDVSKPSSWRWFHLMDQAMTGQLGGKVLLPSQMEEDGEVDSALPPLSPSNMEEDSSGLDALEPASPEGEGGFMDVREVKVAESPPPEDVKEQMFVRSPDWHPAISMMSQTLQLHPDSNPMAPSLSAFSLSRNMEQESVNPDRNLVELQGQCVTRKVIRNARMPHSYRMTDRDFRMMIQLRAANAAIFTGKKNSARRGWRAISKEMGLLGQVSPRQLKKKWDYLQERYKLLKNPPAGLETVSKPNSWRWFHLMDQALSGKLAGTGKIIKASEMDEDEDLDITLQLPSPSNTEEDASGLEVLETRSMEDDNPLMEITQVKVGELRASEDRRDRVLATRDHWQPALNINQTLPPHADADNMASSSSFSSRNMDQDADDLDRKLSELHRERMVLERDQTEFDKELIALEKDRELLNRDMTTIQRERTSLDRDRASMERDRALVERDRAFLERDRAVLDKEKVLLEKDREELERERMQFRRERETAAVAVNGDQAEMMAGKEVLLHSRFYDSLKAADLDPDQLETRQRLLSLFQKLVEKL